MRGEDKRTIYSHLIIYCQSLLYSSCHLTLNHSSTHPIIYSQPFILYSLYSSDCAATKYGHFHYNSYCPYNLVKTWACNFLLITDYVILLSSLISYSWPHYCNLSSKTDHPAFTLVHMTITFPRNPSSNFPTTASICDHKCCPLWPCPGPRPIASRDPLSGCQFLWPEF